LRYPTKRLGTKEAEMKIVGCDLHARQQTIAMVDTETGEFTEKKLVQLTDPIESLPFARRAAGSKTGHDRRSRLNDGRWTHGI